MIQQPGSSPANQMIVQSERGTLQNLLIVAAQKESAGAPVIKRMTDWRILEVEPVCHERDRKH